MANITPIVNGDFAPVYGSFIIGPGNEGGINLDGYRLLFRFEKKDGPENQTLIEEVDGEVTLTLINQASAQYAMDLVGFLVDNQEVVVHLAFTEIGIKEPHRIVTFTVCAA